jgi:hypothetical protein
MSEPLGDAFMFCTPVPPEQMYPVTSTYVSVQVVGKQCKKKRRKIVGTNLPHGATMFCRRNIVEFLVKATTF